MKPKKWLLQMIIFATFFSLLVACDESTSETFPITPAIYYTPPPKSLPTSTFTQIPTPTVTPTPFTPVPPKPISPTGNIHGQIRYKCNDQPVNIQFEVGLFEGSDTSKFQISLNVEEADLNGEFSFNNQPAGSYMLQTERKIQTVGWGFDRVFVEKGKTTNVIIYTLLCPEIILYEPINSVVVTTSKPTFMWEQFSSESRYKVEIRGEYFTNFSLPTTKENYIQSPFDLESGNYQWWVCVKKEGSDTNDVCSLDESFSVDLN